MGINFDALPDKNPNGGKLPKGPYFALIEKAEMKQSTDLAKKPYLNLMYSLTDKDGKKCGKLFDMISESDHEVVRFKTKRFVLSLEIPLKGNFELKDLAKIVVNKKFIVDVTQDKENKNVVDVFTNEVYYPLTETNKIFGIDDIELPFIDETDAADAPNKTTPPSTDY